MVRTLLLHLAIVVYIFCLQVKHFNNDMNVVKDPLKSHVALQSSAEQKNFYDLLHFSPLKVALVPYII